MHVDQIFYYTVNGTSKALSFILIQSARFQCYTEFALKNPALAQKFLDDYKAENQRVADTFDGIITHMQDEWDRMSGPERTEFIFQAITEVIAMPTFQHAYLKGLDDTFNHVSSHMHEAFNKTPSAVTAEGIPIPHHVAEEMLQEAENPVQKVTEAAGTIEETKAPAAGLDTTQATTMGENIAPAIKLPDLAEVAKDLKCDESSAISVLKSYIDKGVMKDNRIEAMIDADSKIVFRKDFGDKAHPIRSHGYTSPVDHYNIEIQAFDSLRGKWNVTRKWHIVIDETGKINFF